MPAPKGLPQPVVDKINAEFVKLYREPKFVDYLEKQAVLPVPGTPAEFAEFLKKDRRDAEFLIRIANKPPEDYKPEQSVGCRRRRLRSGRDAAGAAASAARARSTR